MRVLCDQNVPQKYFQALDSAEGITVRTVASALQHDATDAEITRYAEANDWVVFTNDEDFYADSGKHGLLFYSQLDDPTPGVVVKAIRRIDAAYASATDIVETVPDGWAEQVS